MPLEYALEWDQVDNIIRYLDSFESVVNPRSEGVSANIENFGVFQVPRATSDQTNISYPRKPEAYSLGDGYNVIFDPESVSIESELWADDADAEAAWELCNLYEQSSTLGLTQPSQLPSATVQVSSGIVSNSPLGPVGDAQAPTPGIEESRPLDAQDANTNKTQQHLSLPLTNPLPNVEIPSQERLLMMHYSQRVVNLFCVIDNAKSPWKTIHLPKVLQSAGELSFGCTTSRIRDALKNSLLSISAFCLSNDHRSNGRQTEGSHWNNIASRYRCDAIGLLKYAVETNPYADERPKYKEFLATMLSMITINVLNYIPFLLNC